MNAVVYDSPKETGKVRKKCPHCKKGTLTERARRHSAVKALLFWLPLKRYRCNLCSKKAYVYGAVYQYQ